MNTLIKNKALLNIDNIIKYARIKDYDIFEDNGNYNLNIWFIRSENSKPGRFDDVQIVFWKHDGEWYKHIYTCTTDPGRHYLLNPLNINGTAIVRPGQYKGAWKLGYHQGRKDHPALVQHRPITVIRDFNKDTILDYNIINNDLIVNMTIETKGHNKIIKYLDRDNKVIHLEEEGYFGINNHRASDSLISKIVGRYSAGCLVQNNPKLYYQRFIPTIQNAVDIWGNNFSFTLITEKDIKRKLYEH